MLLTWSLGTCIICKVHVTHIDEIVLSFNVE